MIEEDGHPSIGALRAAVSNCTAALLINNPDDMGIYNPHIAEWVRIVHEAGGLAFCDHANSNGAKGRFAPARSAPMPGWTCCTKPSRHPRTAAARSAGRRLGGPIGASWRRVERQPRRQSRGSQRCRPSISS